MVGNRQGVMRHSRRRVSPCEVRRRERLRAPRSARTPPRHETAARRPDHCAASRRVPRAQHAQHPTST
eukprot:4083169-Prymnesium_polylepis.1